MKKLTEVTLGVLTAIGAFVDIGDLVANAATGARFRMTLAWAVVLGTLGIVLYAEMVGRVATLSKRASFDVVRERMGARIGMMNLGASFLINLLTFAAEIGGIALILQMASNANYLLFVPAAGLIVWAVIWRVKFQTIERLFGLMGLALLVWIVALYQAHPNWHALTSSALHPHVPHSETHLAYWYWAVSLIGATMTVYEVFFFSSGAIEEGWKRDDLVISYTNVYIGFPLGAVLSLTLMALATVFLAPRGIDVEHLSQVTIPTAMVLGKAGYLILLVGMFAAVFGAAIETAMSNGYIVAQYFGWQWGKSTKPREASRFHLVVLLTVIIGVFLTLSTIDPIKLTEFSIVLVPVAAPFTYLPILLAANDPKYVGDKVNNKVTNFLATAFFGVLIATAIAAIPLMILSKGGS